MMKRRMNMIHHHEQGGTVMKSSWIRVFPLLAAILLAVPTTVLAAKGRSHRARLRVAG